MNADQNPYASPVDLSSARWDHSLIKRIFYACLTIAIFYLLASAGATWQSYHQINGVEQTPLIEQVKAFFTDWKAERGLPTRLTR